MEGGPPELRCRERSAVVSRLRDAAESALSDPGTDGGWVAACAALRSGRRVAARSDAHARPVRSARRERRRSLRIPDPAIRFLSRRDARLHDARLSERRAYLDSVGNGEPAQPAGAPDSGLPGGHDPMAEPARLSALSAGPRPAFAGRFRGKVGHRALNES